MTQPASLRDRLRALPVFTGELPRFDTEASPASPLDLLTEWLEFAIEAGVSQPHAMSLATATSDGEPSNRTLLLKDVDDEAVWFGSLSTGPKGLDLAENPRVALLLYWREQGRQVRIVGTAMPGPRSMSDADFLARKPDARAWAIAGAQSEPIGDVAAELSAARAVIAADPGFVPETWVAYRVVPTSVEFWQAERERDQVRQLFTAVDGGWVKSILWP
jgi:pyridoxamine 5'-phosphate oxidase